MMIKSPKRRQITRLIHTLDNHLDFGDRDPMNKSRVLDGVKAIKWEKLSAREIGALATLLYELR